MIPFRDLSEDRQMALREAWAVEMAKQATTCSMDDKIARFAAWLAPQGGELRPRRPASARTGGLTPPSDAPVMWRQAPCA